MPYTNTRLITSCTDNNGERTVLRTVLSPYATEGPHVHAQFTELFYVEAGELDVQNGFGKVHLELGQAVSIERHTVHQFVAGKEGAVLTITLEPGSLNFENAIRIIQGMQHDGTYTPLNTSEGTRLVFSAMLAQLMDAQPIGDLKEQVEALLASEEGYRMEVLKRELLERYCS